MRSGLEALTAVFALLFLAQTAIFIYLYKRALTNRDVTVKMENHTTSQQLLYTPQATSYPTTPEKREELPTLNESALAALRLIRERGSVISSDVSRSLNLSREHTARIMKNLYEMGLVLRSGKPFKYSLTEKGLALAASHETKNHG
ncbi:MAG: winged helix DNA-binding protein [Candidatus Caldarchaeum sp.]